MSPFLPDKSRKKGCCLRLTLPTPCPCSDVECIVQQGLQPRDVALLLLDAFAQQTYKDGFTHGDPHPGGFPPRLHQTLLF